MAVGMADGALVIRRRESGAGARGRGAGGRGSIRPSKAAKAKARAAAVSAGAGSRAAPDRRAAPQARRPSLSFCFPPESRI